MPARDEHIRPRESNKFMANSAALMSRSLSGFSDSGSGSSKQLSDVEPYCSSDVAGVQKVAQQASDSARKLSETDGRRGRPRRDDLDGGFRGRRTVPGD